MRIAVAYSPAPREVDLTQVDLPDGSTAAEALAASGLLARHAALATGPLRIGRWGRPCEPQTRLDDGDRVEVYRSLQVDPKEARRRRGRLSTHRPR